MTDLPAAEGRTGDTPGAVLAAAREAAGLTPADVAGQMRISLRQLEAIESDRYEALPGAVFVRGFVRNYARLLNLDPLPLLHALEPALSEEAPLRAQHFAGALPVQTRRGHARAGIALAVVLLLVLGAASYEFWRSRTSGGAVAVPEGAPARPQNPSEPTAAAPRAPGTTSEPVALAPERMAQQAAPEAPAPASPAEAAAAAAAPSAPAAAAAEAAPAGRGGRIEFSFIAESWIEVRDRDGSVLYSATGAANTTRTVEGTPPLAVVVGNAAGVRITYNQKPIDVAANANRNIARLTLE